MNFMEMDVYINKIIDKFSEDSQIDKLEEEFKELIVAIKNKDKENMEEEIGDCFNMLIQFTKRYDLNAPLILRKAYDKLKRIDDYFNTGEYKGSNEKLKGEIK